MAQKKPQQSLQYSDEEYFQKADNLIQNSCLVLRSLFRQRWKHTTGKEWSEASAHELNSWLGKEVYSKARPIQKKLLDGGKLEEWDMTLLGLLLKHKQINWKRDGDKDNKLKEENQAVEQLLHLRNNAAHMATKKLTKKSYRKIEESVRAQLAILGASPGEIEGLIENAGALPPVSGWSAAMQILEKGEEQFRNKNYREAIKLYGDALQIPNLLQQNRAILLEKRAEAHLALAECIRADSERKKSFEESLKDAKQSLEYKNDSWKAHHIAGRIHRHKNKLDLAVEHLNKSLAISPGQKEVKAELDCCKFLLGKLSRSEHLDPSKQPMTFEEFTKHFTKEMGQPMTKEKWFEMETKGAKLRPGQSDVQTGFRYVSGWGVKQDYLEASRYYAEADELGNATGTYNLAQLYMEGKGVQQCIATGVELLRKAASMPPEIYLGYNKHEDVGVNWAQHAIGLLYHEGVHVRQDYAEAAKWYEKATGNGNGKAANNLALLYADGKGVEQDMEKAVGYWKLAAMKKSMNAALSLHAHYRKEMEPELARIMFERSIELGNDHLTMVKQQVMAGLRKIEKVRAEMEPDVIAFEKENGLDVGGLTFHQRLLRKMRGDGADGNMMADTMEAFRGTNSESKWAGKVKEISERGSEIQIMQMAEEGSITAQRWLYVFKGSYHFMYLWNNGPPFSDIQSKQLIDVIHQCFITEHHLIRLPKQVINPMISYLEAQLRIHGHANSDMDRKLRICYCIGRMEDTQNLIEVLEVGLERYPDDHIYYEMLSSMYGTVKNYKVGLEVAEKGLSQFPDNANLLFDKAAHLRFLSKPEETKLYLQAYQKFISKAERDHRKVPEAYYVMAISFMETEDYDKMLKYYHRGKEAEKIQLPCYLPYDSSSEAVLSGPVKFIQLHGPPGSGSKIKSDTLADRKAKSSATLPPKVPRNLRPHLQDPWRLIRIKEHREDVNDIRKKASFFKHSMNFVVTLPPRFQHKLPRSLSELKSIKMNEIDASKDHICEGRILNLTIIEDAILGAYTSVHTVAEDDNGDVVWIHVYNVPHNQTTAKKLGFGSRLSVIDPYLRIGSCDFLPFIRVDDPKCIIYNEGVKDMCRYCGEENARYNCAKCKSAKYCSKLCQERDWKLLHHKLICA